MPKEYWTYQLETDEECETQYPTKHEAEVAAAADFARQCAEGEEAKEEQIVTVTYRQYTVTEIEYLPELSAKEEHGTWGR